MAVVRMQKVAVVAHRSERETLLDFLHREGVMEISDMRESPNIEHKEVPYRAAELDHVIAKLTEVASKQTLSAMGKPSSEKDIIQAGLHADVRGIIDRVHAVEEAHGRLHHALHELEKGILPRSVHVGSLDVNGAEEGTYFKGNVKEDLSKFGGLDTTMTEEMAEQLKVERAAADKKLQENHEKLAELSKELPTLVRARQYVKWLDQQHAAREAMKSTKTTVTLFGWISERLFAPLELKLGKVSPATALLKVEPNKGEEPPVLLKNHKLLQPFESVTNLYGLPQASEFDPTPLLAPFFILFFGLCLTDAGYGLILAAVMAGIIIKKRMKIADAPLIWLLLFSGVFTFLVSIPFGGWFGLTPDQAPAFMTEMRADGKMWFKGQIWNLGETPGITFLQYLSLALGLVHLSFGMLLAGVAKWRNGNKAAAFWVDWTSLILFAAIGAYFVVPPEFQQNSLYGIYAAAVLLVWGKGYGSKIYLRPIMGLLGLLNLAMGMLSNTLSYLRLLALGLVTGALALAVNLVAQQIGALFPPIVGIPVSIAIYIVGHTLNIALNVLGAFIHSGRLQFVEFFGQFFEGGGRPFVPFKRSNVH